MIFNLEKITKLVTLDQKLSATSKREFEHQFLALRKEHRELEKIVYIFYSESAIPRMKGESPVVYIGGTTQGFFYRYGPQDVRNDIKTFGDRYKYIIETYGPISISFFETHTPEKTESDFLYQYHSKHLELPPLNLKSYQTSLLDT